MDYLLINEPINVYILTAYILIKSLKKSIKNILEVENEEIFMAIKSINLDEIDFDNVIIQCEEFIKDNLEEIFEIQENNKKRLFLLGDFNFRGVENLIYSYNYEILEERYIRKKSWIISYQFIFVLFLTWIFVIYFFHKDTIFEKLSDNNIKTEKGNDIYDNFNEDDDL